MRIYIINTVLENAVLSILSEYKDRSYIVTRRRHIVIVSLISHLYGD